MEKTEIYGRDKNTAKKTWVKPLVIDLDSSPSDVNTTFGTTNDGLIALSTS